MKNQEINNKTLIYLGPEKFFDLIKSYFTNYEVLTATNSENIDDKLKHATVILDACLEIPFDRERLTKAKNLQVFATASTGYTHIDSNELIRRKIKLISLKGKAEFLKNITPAAEHSWLLLMMCARKVRSAILDLENDIWERTRYPGLIMKGKTLGIIGVGRIGKWMAKYAESFEMNCLGYDPYPSEVPQNMKIVSLDDLVKQSDFVTLHVNYEKKLEKFISAELIKKFKLGSVFINTSRGELVDEEALINSFLNGQIISMGLDVLTDEKNYTNSNLYKLSKKHRNIIITPHIGGYSPEVLPMVLNYICKQIISYTYQD